MIQKPCASWGAQCMCKQTTHAGIRGSECEGMGCFQCEGPALEEPRQQSCETLHLAPRSVRQLRLHKRGAAWDRGRVLESWQHIIMTRRIARWFPRTGEHCPPLRIDALHGLKPVETVDAMPHSGGVQPMQQGWPKTNHTVWSSFFWDCAMHGGARRCAVASPARPTAGAVDIDSSANHCVTTQVRSAVNARCKAPWQTVANDCTAWR